jgi:hypothetical protein
LPDRGQGEALATADASQKCIRQLDEDSGAIALQWVGSGGSAMSEILQYLQGLSDDRVAFLAFDMGDKAQAAGVMLAARVVQALFAGWVARVSGSLIHVVLTAFRNDKHVDPTARLHRNVLHGAPAPKPFSY